nr:GntR family transcriptional regulator [Brevibacterium daeguense]
MRTSAPPHELCPCDTWYTKIRVCCCAATERVTTDRTTGTERGSAVTESSTILDPLPKVQSRSEVVAAAIREAILSQRMRPGDTLVERRIAEDLGVSKTPVREALIMLQQSGLVTSAANRRMTVASLTFEDVVHIYEERALLEPWAVRKADLTEDSVRLAEEALDRATRARAEDNGAEAALANRAFHRALYASCSNPLIVRSLDGLQDLTALATATVVWQNWGSADLEHDEHREILRTALSGNQDEAGSLLEAHIRRSITSAREHLAAADDSTGSS